MGIRRAEISDGGVTGVTETCETCDGTGELHDAYPFPESLIDDVMAQVEKARWWAQDERAIGPSDVEEREVVALALMTAYEQGCPRVENPVHTPLVTGVWEMSHEDLEAHLRAHHGYDGDADYTVEDLRYIHDDHEVFSVPKVSHEHEPRQVPVPEYPSPLDMHIVDFRDHMVAYHDPTGDGEPSIQRMPVSRLIALHQTHHERKAMVVEHTHRRSENFNEQLRRDAESRYPCRVCGDTGQGHCPNCGGTGYSPSKESTSDH